MCAFGSYASGHAAIDSSFAHRPNTHAPTGVFRSAWIAGNQIAATRTCRAQLLNHDRPPSHGLAASDAVQPLLERAAAANTTVGREVGGSRSGAIPALHCAEMCFGRPVYVGGETALTLTRPHRGAACAERSPASRMAGSRTAARVADTTHRAAPRQSALLPVRRTRRFSLRQCSRRIGRIDPRHRPPDAKQQSADHRPAMHWLQFDLDWLPESRSTVTTNEPESWRSQHDRCSDDSVELKIFKQKHALK